MPFRPLPVQLALLSSRSMAEGVLRTCRRPRQDLEDTSYYVDYSSRATNWYRRLRGLEPEVESPQRRRCRELQNARVSFDTRMGHGIVTISAAASKPQVASDIVATYRGAPGSHPVLQHRRHAGLAGVPRGQATDEADMQASEEALRAFTAGHGGIKVPEQAQATVGE